MADLGDTLFGCGNQPLRRFGRSAAERVSRLRPGRSGFHGRAFDVVGGAGAVVVEAAEAKEVMSAMEVRTEGAITTMMNMSIVPKERSTGR